MPMQSFIRIGLLLLCMNGWIFPTSGLAASAKDQYFTAEACYRKLLQDTKDQKYRDNWLRCIGKYQAVYLLNPNGSWAAAGLYMSGSLYQELYKRSYKLSDKQEAIDLFERIINRYPESAYKPKAEAAIKSLALKEDIKPSSVSSSGITAKDKYHLADACYRKLLKNVKRQKYRQFWLECIEDFQDVYHQDPSGEWAAAGLYMSGKLYWELYSHSFLSSDREASIGKFQQIVSQYPNSLYHERAQAAIQDISGYSANSKAAVESLPSRQSQDTANAYQMNAATENDGNIAEKVTGSDSQGNTSIDSFSESASIIGLRYWSNQRYTRVVVDADKSVPYTHRLLNRDPSINKFQRLYIDISNGQLGADISTDIPINDNLLAGARVGQYSPDTVRVVVDIKSYKTYKIFSLNSPYRIVIDVWGEDSQDIIQNQSPEDMVKDNEKILPSALAKQLALGVKCIVIDPGHGGKDYGAPGCLKGVHEKDIVLKISHRLAKKVREKLGCKVIMTRETDKYLTLEERTAIANTHNADLFISIHTNAAKDDRAYGIMTFILNLATDDESIRVAARENATSTKNISDLQTILSELMQNAKINESSRLASHVQKSTCEHLQKKYSRINSKGVKQAPFYVLLGAQMPAVLVETSFISNTRECKRLKDPAYQDRLAEGIFQGIQEYIRETNPTVFLKNQPPPDSKG